MSTLGASILAVGYVLPIFYLLWSLKYGKVAGKNPWRASGLEWQAESPPPVHNFHKTPFVVGGPYHYGKKSRDEQSEPMELDELEEGQVAL
jgi:cytochrome c oxidase subunit 1